MSHRVQGVKRGFQNHACWAHLQGGVNRKGNRDRAAQGFAKKDEPLSLAPAPFLNEPENGPAIGYDAWNRRTTMTQAIALVVKQDVATANMRVHQIDVL